MVSSILSQLIESVGGIDELQIDLMMETLDIIKVYEEGRVVVRFYDGTEIEYQGE